MIGTSLLLAAAASSTLLDGLVGYWKLDGDGNDVLGVSNGVVQGTGVTWGAGKIGQSMHVSAAGGRVNAGGAAQIKPTTAITVGGWFWFNNTGWSGRYCSDWHQDGGKDRWIMPFASGDQLFFHMGVNCALGIVGTTIPVNTWVHLVGTASFIALGAYAMTSYRDGAVIATATGSTLFRSGAGNVCIGQQEEAGNAINGRIDDFGMWNRALTAPEVTEWYNAGAGKSHPF